MLTKYIISAGTTPYFVSGEALAIVTGDYGVSLFNDAV